MVGPDGAVGGCFNPPELSMMILAKRFLNKYSLNFALFLLTEKLEIPNIRLKTSESKVVTFAADKGSPGSSNESSTKTNRRVKDVWTGKSNEYSTM